MSTVSGREHGDGCIRGRLRVAQQKVDQAAAARADREFQGAKELAIKSEGTGRLSVRCADNALRTHWMDAYVAAGGHTQELCEERVASFHADATIAQITDKVFASRHPEFDKRKLTLKHEDRDLRTEWMDLYVEYGGLVSVICDPVLEKALGIGRGSSTGSKR